MAKSLTHKNLWITTLLTFLSLVIINHFFELNQFQFILHNFSDRAIGITVLQGVDISQRSFLYAKIIIVFVAIYLILHFLVLKIQSFIQERLCDQFKREQNILLVLSSCSIFLIIYGYIQSDPIYKNIVDLFTLLILQTSCMLFLKYIFKKKNPLFFSFLNNYNFIILSLMSPIVVFFIRLVLIKGTFIFKQTYLLPYFVVWSLFWIIVYVITRSFSNNKALLFKHGVLRGAIPFLLIPASVVLSNEIQFTLSNTIFNGSVYTYSTISVVLLLTISLITFLTSILKGITSSKKFASNIYIPIFIATIVLFKVHSNFIELPIIVDMFHHGENLISTQQLFVYNKIPFIDIYPTHGISYMIGQSLYSLVNGYRSFEPWLWEWVVKIIEVLLLYSVFKKITNSFFAVVTISFLPFLGMFGGNRFIYGYDTKLLTTYYFAALLPCLTLAWALKKPYFKRMSMYWIACVFLLLWRIDFGISNIISGVSIFTILLIGQKLGNVKMRIKLLTLAKSVALVSLISFFIFMVGIKISNTSLQEVVVQNFKFISFQAATVGLIEMVGSISAISLLQYFILPSIGIIYILIFAINILFKRRFKLESKDIILVSIAFFSLIISIRSTQRQTLAVLSLNQYLFVFLGMCLPFYLNVSKNTSIVIFIVLLLGYQIILPGNLLLIKNGKQFEQQNWINKESRVKINDQQYKNITSFLKNNLGNGQTFIDLTSSPLLYVTTNKEFVNYLVPNAYYTSEQIQKIMVNKIHKLSNENKIPIVIFKQPVSAANAIDGVPNEIRSYRIYEFIYTNYAPLGTIDNYTIWVKKGFTPNDKTNLVSTIDNNVVQTFELKKLPYIWANLDDYDAIHNSELQNLLIKSPIKLNQNISKVIEIDKEIDKSTGNYIYLNIDSTSSGTLQIAYGNIETTESTIRLDIITSTTPINYLVRISSQYNWINNKVNRIILTSDIDMNINKLEIRKGD